jgi:CRISPR-associated protein Csm2
MSKVSKESLRAIITDGDAEATVRVANELGYNLAQKHKLSTSQIRNIFGTVRRIEMTWPEEPEGAEEKKEAEQAQRELVLLKPKMAYQAKRAAEAKPLAHVLSGAIDLVMEGERVGIRRQRFQHLVDFFEAMLAYHKAHDGKTN